MTIKKKFICVGLFGTCGSTTFRKDKFIPEYEEREIPFFNPQVEDWNPELAVEEADHLANDRIILFPITKETYGLGSLSEIGFSILNAIKLDDRRNFVIMIEQNLDKELMKNSELSKESLRSRALVSQHLKKLNFSNLYIVDSLDNMLLVSIELYENALREFYLKQKFCSK